MSQISQIFNLSRRNLQISSALMTFSFLICFILSVSDFNKSLMLSIHSNSVLPSWFWSVMNLGGDAWVVLLVLLLADPRPGYLTSWIIKTWLLGAFLVQSIKYFFPMPRPASVLGVERLSLIDSPPLVASSMPSGHALAAVSCGLILIALLKHRDFKFSTLLIVACVSCVAAWARVAVGAHWPSDVIAGAGLAVLALVISTYWELRSSWYHWFKSTGGQIFLIVLHLLIAIHLFQPQSKLLIVQLVQFSLSALSICRAYLLLKEFLSNSSLISIKKP
jgi:membrane-associated phospholipid phosphatase